MVVPKGKGGQLMSDTERKMLLAAGVAGTAYGAHQLYRTFFPKGREKEASVRQGFFNKIARTPHPTVDRETGQVMWPEYRPAADTAYHRGYEQEYERSARKKPYRVSSMKRELLSGGLHGAAAGAIINRLRGGTYGKGALVGGALGAGLGAGLYALGGRMAKRHVRRGDADARSAMVEHYVEQMRRDPSRTIQGRSRVEKKAASSKTLEPHIDPRGARVYWPKVEAVEGRAEARGYVDRHKGRANPFFYRHLAEGASGALKGGLAGAGMGILAAHATGRPLVSGAKWGGGIGAAATGLGQMALYHKGRRRAAREMSQQNREVLEHMSKHYSKHDKKTSEAFERASKDPSKWEVGA
jgi:hypothetical protein